MNKIDDTRESQRPTTETISNEAMDMPFYNLAKNRYSERYFSSRQIEKDKLDRILEVGRMSPTACNYQPQRFYIIRNGTEAYEKLKQVTPFHYHAPLVLLVAYDLHDAWTNPGDRYYQNYNSGEQDVTIAATSMMFEAEEEGIHTIWVRGFDSQSVVQIYGLPENIIPVMMLGLGYPNDQAKANPWHYKRMPIENFVKEL